MYISTLSLTSAFNGVRGQRHASAVLPRERPSTHCIGSWVDPRAGPGRMRKMSPPLGFDPRTVQRVAIPTELSRLPIKDIQRIKNN